MKLLKLVQYSASIIDATEQKCKLSNTYQDRTARFLDPRKVDRSQPEAFDKTDRLVDLSQCKCRTKGDI